MKVYRIVGKDKQGIYTGSMGTLMTRLSGGRSTERHPAPYVDGIPEFDDSHYCGFRSVAQLRDWMELEWIKELSYAGATIRVYEVHGRDVLFGNKQLCFKMSEATLLTETKLMDYIDV